ncbi:MAG: GDSL-type esterase/lipase family protein [bacterium]
MNNKNNTLRFAAKILIIATAMIALSSAAYAYNDKLVYQLRVDGNVPKGAVVFIGDSITEGLCVAAVADKAVNFGIAGDTTTGVLARIPMYKSLPRAKAIILAIGVNDLWRGQRTDEQILSNLRLVLMQLPHKVPVVFSAILPIDEQLEKDRYGGNSHIETLNEQTVKLCAQFKNCHYFSSYGKLLGPNGQLVAEYHVGDGLHISPKGYDIWIADMQKALEELKNESSE